MIIDTWASKGSDIHPLIYLKFLLLLQFLSKHSKIDTELAQTVTMEAIELSEMSNSFEIM